MDALAMAVAGGAALAVLSRIMGGRRAPANVVADRIEAGAQIVDVRSEREFRQQAYPGAVNIPLGVLATRLGQLARDRPVVLYCRSGARSAAAARVLKRAGFEEVLNAGGLHHMPR